MISYPSTFLERPCDRDLLQRLRAAGCPDDTAEILLYRIWRDFSSGGSDRRLLQTEQAGPDDRAVELLESFCRWDRIPQIADLPGALVSYALAAEFLSIESGPEGCYLVCRDFYPINSRFSAGGKSMQRKGALTQVLTRESRRANDAATQHAELWDRAPQSEFDQYSPAVREQALLFLHTLCNCSGKAMPPDHVLRGGLFGKAVECLRTPDQERKDTLLYLISLRKDPAFMRKDFSALLHEWPEFVTQAKREGV